MTLSRRDLEEGRMREVYIEALAEGHALTDEQLFAIASGRASEIQVIEHEPAPGLGTDSCLRSRLVVTVTQPR